MDVLLLLQNSRITLMARGHLDHRAIPGFDHLGSPCDKKTKEHDRATHQGEIIVEMDEEAYKASAQGRSRSKVELRRSVELAIMRGSPGSLRWFHSL